MLDENGRDSLRKGMVIIWIIWAAMIISALIYVLLAHLLSKNWTALQPNYLSTLRNALYIVAVVEILIIAFFRNRMLESRSDSWVFKSALVAKQYSTPALGKYTTVSIVSWTLAESVAIYGLLPIGQQTAEVFE